MGNTSCRAAVAAWLGVWNLKTKVSSELLQEEKLATDWSSVVSAQSFLSHWRNCGIGIDSAAQ